jgi:hypothetical protein
LYRPLVVERKDVEAALAARHELGPEYDDQIVDALVEKIERRLDERRPAPRPALDLRLPLASFALGIPVTAVALSNAPGAGGVAVAIVAWIAIAVANLGYALRR